MPLCEFNDQQLEGNGVTRSAQSTIHSDGGAWQDSVGKLLEHFLRQHAVLGLKGAIQKNVPRLRVWGDLLRGHDLKDANDRGRVRLTDSSFEQNVDMIDSVLDSGTIHVLKNFDCTL